MELTPRDKDKLMLFTAAQLAERRKARGHASAILRRGQPQHLDQQVAGDRTLECVDPAGGQRHHVGQALQQGVTRLEALGGPAALLACRRHRIAHGLRR